MKSVKEVPAGLRITAYISLLCAAVFAAAQTLMVNFMYENDVHLFKQGSVAPTVFNIALAVFVLAVFIIFCAAKNASFPDEQAKISSPAVIFSALCAFTAITSGLHNLISFAMLLKMSQAYQFTRHDIFSIIAAVMSIPAFIYFIINAFAKDISRRVKAGFGTLCIVWSIMYLLSIYFDMTGPINDPIRIINQFAVLSVMMYMVYEVRFLLEDPRPGYYICFSLVAVVLLGASSVSNIICTLTGALDFSDNLIYFFFELSMLCYVLSRIIPYLRLKTQAPLPEDTAKETEQE